MHLGSGDGLPDGIVAVASVLFFDSEKHFFFNSGGELLRCGRAILCGYCGTHSTAGTAAIGRRDRTEIRLEGGAIYNEPFLGLP